MFDLDLSNLSHYQAEQVKKNNCWQLLFCDREFVYQVPHFLGMAPKKRVCRAVGVSKLMLTGMYNQSGQLQPMCLLREDQRSRVIEGFYQMCMRRKWVVNRKSNALLPFPFIELSQRKSASKVCLPKPSTLVECRHQLDWDIVRPNGRKVVVYLLSAYHRVQHKVIEVDAKTTDVVVIYDNRSAPRDEVFESFCSADLIYDFMNHHYIQQLKHKEVVAEQAAKETMCEVKNMPELFHRDAYVRHYFDPENIPLVLCFERLSQTAGSTLYYRSLIHTKSGGIAKPVEKKGETDSL